MKINPGNIIDILIESFNCSSDREKTPVNTREIELSKIIIDLISRYKLSKHAEIETEQELIFENLTQENEEETVIPSRSKLTDQEFESSSDNEEGPEDQQYLNIHCQYKEEAVNYWNSGKRKRLSLHSVKTRYRKVKSVLQLYRWEEQVKKGGTRAHKLEVIGKETLGRFMEARDRNVAIHDNDIRRWALQENQRIKLEGFRASAHWLQNFKEKHNIVSRKTTKLITCNYNENLSVITASAENFVLHAKTYFENIDESNIFNTDQSGFQLEIHSGRTLSWKGEKQTKNLIQSSSAVTHSYTIQPTVSADGKLLSPLFIVLKEVSGQLGPRVRQNIFQAPNIFIGASTSGKLNKDLLQTWFMSAFLPNVSEKAVLLFDSWTGYDEGMMQDVTPNSKTIEFLKIPKNTTPLIQPLDVYGFRIWKNFARKLSDLTMLLNIDINLSARNNIIKLQSLIHNQLSSPRYKNLFKYAWFQCGYTDIKPEEFENPVDFCFTCLDTMNCHSCDDIVSLKCSWCKQHLCFKHFFENYHYCENYSV